MNSAMQHPDTMMALLTAWTERGWLRQLDLALLHFLVEQAPATDPALMLAITLVSHQLGRGHVCLDLAAALRDPYRVLSLPPDQDQTDDGPPLPQPAELLTGLNITDWCQRLQSSALVACAAHPIHSNTPLVLVGQRLYLRRYWRYEHTVETAIETRLNNTSSLSAQLPAEVLRPLLDRLFPPSSHGSHGPLDPDWQKIACALAARSAFAIITGGPGTGKTTTVIRLLALLQSLALGQDATRPLQIRLAAPTGKAAARLQESIAGAIEKLPGFVLENAALKASIPVEVTTLHRLLGVRPQSRLFRHDARNPLPVDVLVIDEASMVDLEMMAAVLTALPASARLILLGDKDQLASVEAGSVLGELCRHAAAGHLRDDTVAWIQQMTGATVDTPLQDTAGRPLDQHIVMLRTSHRFTADSGIGQLAAAVNAGDSARIQQVWAHGYGDLSRLDLPHLNDAHLEQLLLGPSSEALAPASASAPSGYARYLHLATQAHPALEADKSAFDTWARQVLQAHSRFQLLCALRSGPYGVAGLNQHVEQTLARHQLIDPAQPWYEGRPLLVTRNDYNLGLMNGDIGITLRYPCHHRTTGAPNWSMRVAFAKNDGSGDIQWVLPSRLLAVETVYALTVHKSQGSEFDHCALLLPPTRNPVLTRELVYTGITRGKRNFSLICINNPQILDEAVHQTVQRSGGLFAASAGE
jgi:exodeoxyribonuclease V alpha subunit